MPVPREEDMITYCMLHALSKLSSSPRLKEFVSYMKSHLTRIKLAFEGDAGAKFLDFAPAGELQPKFKYGFGKLLSANASVEEIGKRKNAAMTYKTCLKGNNRNEIVVAYRQFGRLGEDSIFPVYAKGVFDEGDHKGFVVVDENMNDKTLIIDLQACLLAGTVKSFGARAEKANDSRLPATSS
jgi:hypothetical protein